MWSCYTSGPFCNAGRDEIYSLHRNLLPFWEGWCAAPVGQQTRGHANCTLLAAHRILIKKHQCTAAVKLLGQWYQSSHIHVAIFIIHRLEFAIQASHSMTEDILIRLLGVFYLLLLCLRPSVRSQLGWLSILSCRYRRWDSSSGRRKSGQSLNRGQWLRLGSDWHRYMQCPGHLTLMGAKVWTQRKLTELGPLTTTIVICHGTLDKYGNIAHFIALF